MVVFRCECEEVLAVEENSGDRLGECPSCGVIVRVPANASNLKGKLRRKAATSQAMRSVPAAPPPIAAATAVAEPEPQEAEPADAVEAEPIEAPVEVQEAVMDAEIADLRANTVPSAGHSVEEGFAKHSEDEVSSAQEVDPIETPQEVAEPLEVEAAPDLIPETVADNSGYAEAPAEVEPVAEAAVEEAPAETVEEVPMETVSEKKKLSKRERLKLKKKNRGFEEAPVAEEAAPVEAPVAEMVEEPAAPVEEVPAQMEEPVAVTTEEVAPPVEEAPAEKSRSGLKSGIKKPMGMKGKAAIGSSAASSARKGVASARPKKDVAADGEAPKKGKSGLFILGALVLVGALAAGWYVMREQPAEPVKGGTGEGKKEAPTEEKKTDEAPKTDAPKSDAPEAPKADAPKSDAPEAPKADAPKTDAPKADAPAGDAPKADAPKADAPKSGALPKEAPTAPAE